MDNGTGIPWDLCPGTEIPGLGNAIRTDSLGTLATRTNIAWTVPGQKISETTESQALGPLGTLKNLGTVSLVPCTSLAYRYGEWLDKKKFQDKRCHRSVKILFNLGLWLGLSDQFIVLTSYDFEWHFILTEKGSANGLN